MLDAEGVETPAARGSRCAVSTRPSSPSTSTALRASCATASPRSVGQLFAPFTHDDAREAFEGFAASRAGAGWSWQLRRRDLVGTVQVILALPPNQPHRAEIAKLLVHRSRAGAASPSG